MNAASLLLPKCALARLVAGATLGLAALLTSASTAAQSVPGFTVSDYASLSIPSQLSFGPDGVLYAGTDNLVSGGSAALKVHKVAVGGTPVTQLGSVGITDPDCCVLDVAGSISGVPGSVLVGGLIGSSSIGRISAIHPDGSVATVFDNGNWANVVEMKFDGDGRLIFTAIQAHAIWVSTGGTPTILATLPGSVSPRAFDIAPDNRIAVVGTDNVIRVYNPDGSVANASLATLAAVQGLAYGPGGAFGTDLYALSTSSGTLVRIDGTGATTTVGTGFPTGTAIRDIEFGPSGDLFVSVTGADKVQRISAQWDFLGCALPGTLGHPLLVGSGTLASGSNNSVALSKARPSAFAGMFVGFQVGAVAFKGGTLKPFPFFDLLFTTTSGAGKVTLPFVMPPGVPSGTDLVVQWAIQDPLAVRGVALSNAVRGVTP